MSEVTVVVRDLLLEPKKCACTIWKKNTRHTTNSMTIQVHVQRTQFTLYIQHGYTMVPQFPVITRLRNETYSHHKKHTQSKRGIQKKSGQWKVDASKNLENASFLSVDFIEKNVLLRVENFSHTFTIKIQFWILQPHTPGCWCWVMTHHNIML